MAADPPTIGRAKTVLVFGSGMDAHAVITAVVAQVRQDASGKRVHFAGPVEFEPRTVRQISEVILPIADRIVAALGLQRLNFTLSVANLGAASISNLGLEVSGFSADLPVLLAMLSAALHMPVAADLVSTGHIASMDGDLTAVEALPAKLAASVADGSIRRFVHPRPARDRSLETLAPSESDRIDAAVIDARDKIQVSTVSDVAELVRDVFNDETVVLASLLRGFFAESPLPGGPSDVVSRAAEYLLRGNDRRFWGALERHLLSGEIAAVGELLRARVNYHVTRRSYPTDFGCMLLQLVRSMPPACRRLKNMFPLLSTKECIALSQFAGDSDHEDVRRLYDVVFGNRIQRLPAPCVDRRAEAATGSNQSDASLDAVLRAIDPLRVAELVSAPIDSARAAYSLHSSVATSHDEFIETVGGFYVHLLRHTRGVTGTVDRDAATAGALDLLERAFSRQGGVDSAVAEARDGTRGGMRYVLDMMADSHKCDGQTDYIRSVLKTALDSRDWDARVAFMTALMARLAPHLHPDLRSQPPERFAKRWELIVQAYVKSLDQVQSLLRTL